ncbi:acyltransferase [Pusillimonas sp. CC-YST705]|uniref:Acyltransferase n=2 Tax=Mesopusillimonas faecipullorum TaxID=2755040 RepID=A0ABS8CB25_9BURK|nr:acyltransferase [Mesopusillimonas faecipullorum]
MVFHANAQWLPGGFVGVDMFFVISGYIVSRLILSPERKFQWAGFYLGRIKRIVPAYLVMLLVVGLIAALLLVPQDFAFFKDSLGSALIFNSNHYFAGFGDYFAPSSDELPLLHTWSLAIEMQFYLVLPFLLVFLPRRALRYGLPVFVIAVLAWSDYAIAQQQSLYFSLLARSAEFGFGVWLALVQPSLRLSTRFTELAGICGAILLVLAFWFTPQTTFPGTWVLLPCVGTSLLLAARESRFNRLISWRIFGAIGAISYSLYLWHWPILAFMRYYTQQYELEASWLVFYGMAAFILAFLSYRYIETPFRSRQNTRRLIGAMLGLVALLGGLQAKGSVLNAGAVAALPEERTRYAQPQTICHGQVVQACIRGDQSKRPSVLVIGDSHAAQLNLAFDELGNRQGLAFKVVTGSSCVPIPEFDIARLPSWAQQACAEQIAYVQGQEQDVDVVVLAAMWQYQNESRLFMQALEDYLAYLKERDVRVVVLGQVPMLSSNVIRMHRFAQLGLPRQPVKVLSTGQSDKQISDLIAAYENARFVQAADFGLFSSPPIHAGEYIYMDSHHLNESGARLYAQELEKIFPTLIQSKEGK